MIPIIRKGLRPFKILAAKLLIKLKVLDKFVLIIPDGGLCSQMHFYMIGRYFQSKGFKVKYTLEWFWKDGFDMNKEYVYNFDLLKAFPDIQIDTANRFETFMYGVFSFHNDYFDRSVLYDWMQLAPPVYLKEYYNTPPEWYSELTTYFKVNYDILDDANKVILKKIRETIHPVAVHVRLGDLTVFNPAYGEPVGADYFKKAISFVEQKKGAAYYFFFSLDASWIKENLIPKLGLDGNYCIVDINGSEKGYMDVFLISACDDQITSKGSMGKFGGLLSQRSDNIITVADDQYERNVWEGADSRIVFI